MEGSNKTTTPSHEKHAGEQSIEEPIKSTIDPTESTNSSNTVSTANGDDIRVLRPQEYKQAAQSLAEAFANDEVARYFTHTPDRIQWTEQQRWDLHVSILDYIVYAHILNGLVLSTGPDYGCVALW